MQYMINKSLSLYLHCSIFPGMLEGTRPGGISWNVTDQSTHEATRNARAAGQCHGIHRPRAQSFNMIACT